MIGLTIYSWIGLFFLSFFVSLYATISGGGALVFIPVFTLMGLPLLPTIASARVIAFFLQLISVFAFNRKMKIDWKLSLWSSLWVIPASVFGASIAVYLSQKVLTIFVVILMLFALGLVLMINIKKLQRKPRSQHFYLLLAIGCILMGLYGGIYGAAFSTLLMIFFIYFGGEELLSASANTSVVATGMAFSASLVYMRHGVVDWNLVTPLVFGGAFGTILSVEIASKKEQGWIKYLLIVIIVATILKLLSGIL